MLFDPIQAQNALNDFVNRRNAQDTARTNLAAAQQADDQARQVLQQSQNAANSADSTLSQAQQTAQQAGQDAANSYNALLALIQGANPATP